MCVNTRCLLSPMMPRWKKDIHGKQIEQILVYIPKFNRRNLNTSLDPRSNEDVELSNRNAPLLPNWPYNCTNTFASVPPNQLSPVQMVIVYSTCSVNHQLKVSELAEKYRFKVIYEKTWQFCELILYTQLWTCISLLGQIPLVKCSELMPINRNTGAALQKCSYKKVLWNYVANFNLQISRGTPTPKCDFLFHGTG